MTEHDNEIEAALSDPPFEDIILDVRRQPDRPRMSFEKGWPDDVWSVGIDRFDFLGVDNDGALYWDGKKVEVRHPLSLTMWQRIGAVALTLSAVVGAAAAAVSAYADIAKP